MSKYRCSRAPGTTYRLDGYVAGYPQSFRDQWPMIAPSANPAMLEMFRDRNRLPYRDLVPWAGEFAGKHLTSAVQHPSVQLTRCDAFGRTSRERSAGPVNARQSF